MNTKFLNDKNHNLLILSFAEFSDRFNFFGILAILVLYLTKAFLLSDQTSYALYGIYIACSFALPSIGGLIADKLIGSFKAIIIGAIFLTIGDILLFQSHLLFIYAGLAAVICGSGIYKTTCTTMVGHIYEDNKNKRDKAYTIFYAIMNAGAILGPVVYGVIASQFGWKYCFLCGGLLILISAIAVFFYRNTMRQQIKLASLPSHGIRNVTGYFALLFGCLLITLAFMHPQYFIYYFIAFSFFILTILLKLTISKTEIERHKIYALLILTFFCIFFFATTLQVGSSITLFISRDINKTILGMHVPTTFFTALDPLFVVLGAPFLAVLWGKLGRINKAPNPTRKLFIGLTLAILGMLFFIIATKFNNNHSNTIVIMMIVFGYLCFGIGEICAAPAIFSAISEHCPIDMQNTAIGVWYLAVAFSGYVGSILTKTSTAVPHRLIQSHSTTTQAFISIFTNTMIVTIGAAIILLILTPLTNKLLSSSKIRQI